LLYLAAQSKVELNQTEFYQEIKVRAIAHEIPPHPENQTAAAEA
jgi:chromatin segregation and condensation protein Rec8/ScpA/Scc1 (kleisin family)